MQLEPGEGLDRGQADSVVRRAQEFVSPLPSAELEVVALQGLDFRMEQGEFVSIVGASGAGVDPRLLELEITESVLLQDAESTLAALNRVKEAGIDLSVEQGEFIALMGPSDAKDPQNSQQVELAAIVRSAAEPAIGSLLALCAIPAGLGWWAASILQAEPAPWWVELAQFVE